jgi:hypothetical protein
VDWPRDRTRAPAVVPLPYLDFTPSLSFTPKILYAFFQI